MSRTESHHTNRTAANLTMQADFAEFYLRSNDKECQRLQDEQRLMEQLLNQTSVAGEDGEERCLTRTPGQDRSLDFDVLAMLSTKCERLLTLTRLTKDVLNNWQYLYGETLDAVQAGDLPPQLRDDPDRVTAQWNMLREKHSDLQDCVEAIYQWTCQTKRSIKNLRVAANVYDSDRGFGQYAFGGSVDSSELSLPD